MIRQFYFTYKEQDGNLLVYDKSISTTGSQVNLINSNYFLEKTGNVQIISFEIQGPPSTEYEIIYNVDGTEVHAGGLLDSSGIIQWNIEKYGFIKTIKIKKLPIIERFFSLSRYSQELLVTLVY